MNTKKKTKSKQKIGEEQAECVPLKSIKDIVSFVWFLYKTKF